ncbi:hypothetical protein [Paenibacillus sp. NPDC058071]|uniref:hypothetical protein n=1 Tax=Paenibacillus sp. NPDC058071 TaxID=3346326 RepID=UPI0036DB599A
MEAKLELASLYTSDPDRLETLRNNYQSEAEKRIANRILSTIRTIIKQEQENGTAIRQAERQYALTEQLLVELLTMMEGLSMRTRMDVDDKMSVMGGELSIQAKKEWMLKHKDRGLERYSTFCSQVCE